jgi:integrase
MTTPFLDKFINMLNQTNLSDSSKQNYSKRLKRLVTLTGHDLNWVIKNPKASLESIDLKEPETLSAYVTAILTLFKNTTLKTKLTYEHGLWLGWSAKLREKREARYDNLVMSERQESGFVPYDELIRIRDTLPKDSMDYLLICMYTMIPPLRADFNAVKILYDIPSKEITTQYPNYLAINKRTGAMTLVIKEFKTATRGTKPLQETLPKELTEVIKESLEAHPRDFLFVNKKGQPMSDHSYTTWGHYRLQKVYGTNVTFNSFRRAKATTVDMNKTPAQRKEVASKMLTSIGQLERYRNSRTSVPIKE